MRFEEGRRSLAWTNGRSLTAMGFGHIVRTGDMGKATPRFLFGQHPDEEIKGMNRRDQGQQVQTE